MIITKSKDLKDRGTLKLGDRVFFGDMEYEVYESFLDYHGDFDGNRKIFNHLEYDAAEVAGEMYGYPASGGDWPESKHCDYEALTRLVAELYAKYEAVEGDIPFPKMVEKLEGYPGKDLPYPAEDRDIQTLHRLSHAGLGIGSEAGEVQSIIKAFMQYGDPIDLRKLVNELGDLKHFMQMLCNITGIDYDDLAPLNAKKLDVRYPGYEFKPHNKAGRSANQIHDEANAFDKYNGRTFS